MTYKSSLDNKGSSIIKNDKCDKKVIINIENGQNLKKGILTTLVRVKGASEYRVVSVKSSAPIEKSLWIECSKALSRIYVGPEIEIGDVVCKNILNTGVDIICTRSVRTKKNIDNICCKEYNK